MTPRRIALINPNADAALTERLVAEAAAAVPGETVEGLTAIRGPLWIESAVDTAIAAAEVATMVRANPDYDAYVIGCFSDPGVDAARELTEAPVIGIGEAAMLAARLVARRFVVLTTLARGIPELEDQVARNGATSACASIVPLGAGVDAADREEAAALAIARDAVAETGCDAIVLACGGMGGLQQRLGDELGLPALTGVASAAAFCRALLDSGLRTSGSGAYGPPEQIPYRDMPAMSPDA